MDAVLELGERFKPIHQKEKRKDEAPGAAVGNETAKIEGLQRGAYSRRVGGRGR